MRAHAPHLRRHVRDAFEDTAVFGGGIIMALVAKVLELRLEAAEFFDPTVDVSDVFVDDSVDRSAVVGGLVDEAEEGIDFLLRHVEGSAVADEDEALKVRGVVEAVVIPATKRGREEALLFVIADRLHCALGRGGQFANLHHGFLAFIA
jgi:hypothetical protein